VATKIVVPIVGKKGQKYDIVTVVEWKVKEGDKSENNTTIAVVETDKASADIEAEASGLLRIVVTQGNRASVGSVIGVIADSDAEYAKLKDMRSDQLASI